MNYLEEVKKIIKIDVPDELLISVVFEMSRFADRKYTLEVKRLQKEANVVFDTPTRKALRRIFYYGKIVSHGLSSYNIRKYDYNNEEINRAFEDFYHRLKTYDSEKIVESMKRRIADLKANTNSDDNMQIWLNEYEKKRKVKMKKCTLKLIN